MTALRWHAERLTDAGERYVSSSRHASVVDDALRELVGASVSDRLGAEPADRAAVAAGAPVSVADASEDVAAVSIPVVGSEGHAADNDRMEHERQSRLHRWQEQRER